MRSILLSLAVLVLLAGALILIDRHNEGPAERLGRDVDRQFENAGDKVENATDSIADSVDDAGDRMQQAID